MTGHSARPLRSVPRRRVVADPAPDRTGALIGLLATRDELLECVPELVRYELWHRQDMERRDRELAARREWHDFVVLAVTSVGTTVGSVVLVLCSAPPVCTVAALATGIATGARAGIRRRRE